jgi:hypothetical protein
VATALLKAQVHTIDKQCVTVRSVASEMLMTASSMTCLSACKSTGHLLYTLLFKSKKGETYPYSDLEEIWFGGLPELNSVYGSNGEVRWVVK